MVPAAPSGPSPTSLTTYAAARRRSEIAAATTASIPAAVNGRPAGPPPNPAAYTRGSSSAANSPGPSVGTVRSNRTVAPTSGRPSGRFAVKIIPSLLEPPGEQPGRPAVPDCL